MKSPIVHNQKENQFEWKMNGKSAVVDYFLNNNIMTITHTYVPRSLEGQGIGAALAKQALDYALENGMKIIPACSFIQVYLARHPEYKVLQVDNRKEGD